MNVLTPRSPCPALSQHPAFLLMLLRAVERFHCTLGEVREDYWLGRVWRALADDGALVGRIAREGVATVVLTGPDHGPPPGGEAERARWRRHVEARIEADTGRPALAHGVAIRWAEGAVRVVEGTTVSLLAQVVMADARFDGLEPYAADLGTVRVPVVVAQDAVDAA